MPRTLINGSGWIVTVLLAGAAVASAGAEPCCLPENGCLNLDPVTCQLEGGVPHPGDSCMGDVNQNGIDDACEPLRYSSCCLSDGVCIVAPEDECNWLGGAASRGGCLGDANGNGLDDACENTGPRVTYCLLGDLNADGEYDALDIQPFVEVLTGQRVDEASVCAANVNGSRDAFGNHTVNSEDVALIIANLVRAPGDGSVMFTEKAKTCDIGESTAVTTKKRGGAREVVFSNARGNCPIKLKRRAGGGGADIAGSDCEIGDGRSKRMTVQQGEEVVAWCDDPTPDTCEVTVDLKPAAALPGEARCP